MQTVEKVKRKTGRPSSSISRDGTPSEANKIASALVMALEKWLNNSAVYKLIYKVLPKEIFDIPRDAFCEMTYMKPGNWEIWWATHHNRYIRNFRQKDLILLHEIMYHFLSAYAQGVLKHERSNSQHAESQNTAEENTTTAAAN